MLQRLYKIYKKKIENKFLGKILYIDILRQNLGPIRSDVSSSYDLASHDLSILIFFCLKKLPILNSFDGLTILLKKKKFMIFLI